MADGRPFPVQFRKVEGKKKKEENDSNEIEKKEQLHYILPDVIERKK